VRLSMQKRKTSEKLFRGNAWLWLIMVVLTLGLTGCESIFGPKAEESTEEETAKEARIVVTNNYGQALDIYMDGKFQFTLESEQDRKIRNVSLDEHKMEAKLPGTNTVVDTETVDVTGYADYAYAIDDPPDINISNNYGKPLKIYMDNVYKFDLLYKENRWIMDVSFGQHFLKAILVENNKEVASTTIDVDQNKDYTWIIQ